jgi:hypothetical protein
MILLWGLENDTPLRLVRDTLAAHGVDHLFVNHCDILDTHLEITYADRISGILQVNGAHYPLEEFRGLYLRPYDFRVYEHFQGLDENSPEYRHAIMFEDMMWGFADLADAVVVNRPSAMLSNSSKPYQCWHIGRHGFRIPETLLTTDPAAAAAFGKRHGAVIYKSISGNRSIVNTLVGDDAERLDDVRWCPTQFQERIEGQEFRVHVVGPDVFACRIVSDAVDYRYAGARYEPADVPRQVASRCVTLAEALGLKLAGVDLRRTPEGEWYCFEVNPSPAYSCYEAQAGLPISGAVAEMLSASLTESKPP